MPPSFVPNSGQLVNVWMTSVSYEENPAFELGRHQAEYDLALTNEVKVTKAGSEVRTQVVITWNEPPNPDEENEVPFDLKIGVAAQFEWSDDIPADYREGWSGFNGPYLLWPYIRSYVTAITALSSLPAFTLPTLAVPRPSPPEDEAATYEALSGDQ